MEYNVVICYLVIGLLIMHIKSYKDGKILLPMVLRKKYKIGDNSELIITDCEDGIKISTKKILLANLRNGLVGRNLQNELNDFRKQEFDLEMK